MIKTDKAMWKHIAKVLLTAVLFGLIIRLTLWFGLFVPVPGTVVQLDAREVLLIFGSCLTGPWGGTVIGFVSSVEPTMRWFPTIMHMGLGWWAGWFYYRFVWKRRSTRSMVASWLGLVATYYLLICFAIVVVVMLLFPALDPSHESGEVGERILGVVQALAWESLFTLTMTLLIFLMIPSSYRVPLWIRPHAAESAGQRNLWPAGLQPPEKRIGHLSLRLMAWFLLLSIVPMVITSVFVRDNVFTALLGAEGGKQREIARSIARNVQQQGLSHATEEFQRLSSSSQALFIIDTNGVYVAHPDSSKVGTKVTEDFPSVLVDKMRRGTIGMALDPQSTLAVGYTAIQGTPYRVIAIQGRKMVDHMLVDLQGTIFMKLGVSLLLISLAGGLIIWILVGRPLKKFTYTAQRVGRGDFTAFVNPDELEDEVALLGRTFNDMTQSLERTHQDMESEIAQRKVTEETLREREQQFRLLAENSTDMISRHDLQGRYLYVSPVCRLLLGYEPDEMVGRSAYDFIHPGDIEFMAEHRRRQVEQRISPPIIYRVLRKDKSFIWFESTSQVVAGGDIGEFEEIHVSSRDITQRMVTELALKESEERLRYVVSNVPVVLYSINKDEIFTLSEGRGLETLGLKPGEVVGMPITKIYGGYPEIIEGNRRALAGEPIHQTARVGSLSFDAWYTPMRDASGNVTGVIGVAIDVTDRKRAEEAVRESERMHKTLVEQSTDPIYVVQNNKLVFVNHAWERTFGYSSAEAMSEGFDLLSIVGEESRAIVAERLNRYASGAGTAPRYEMRGMHRNGSPLDLDVSIARIDWNGKPAIQGIYRDITERKRAEEAIRQSQKSESLGILAGGIAHDFNNLLQAILGQTSLALTRLPEGTPAYQNVAKAEAAAHRAAELTRQLLAYSGRGKFDVRPIDLNTLIHENLHFLELAIPKGVTLQEDLATDLPLIDADSGQIQQVVMNLIINASEAIGNRPGRILLRTSVLAIHAREIGLWTRAVGVLAPGKFIQLEVSDNGEGMTPQTLQQIFDPFFTTKVTGRGLGLSAVIGIVKGHHGGLRVESEAGRRTTFQIVFPVSSEQQRMVSLGSVDKQEPQREGCVLVVDDEADLREVITDMLEEAGIHTLVAENGEQGVELYKAKYLEIDLVLLDLSMPGIGGKETFKRLKLINSKVKVVLTSGYSESEVTDDLKALGLTGFIQKPYRYEKLKDIIVRHLGGGQSA